MNQSSQYSLVVFHSLQYIRPVKTTAEIEMSDQHVRRSIGPLVTLGDRASASNAAKAAWSAIPQQSDARTKIGRWTGGGAEWDATGAETNTRFGDPNVEEIRPERIHTGICCMRPVRLDAGI